MLPAMLCLRSCILRLWQSGLLAGCVPAVKHQHIRLLCFGVGHHVAASRPAGDLRQHRQHRSRQGHMAGLAGLGGGNRLQKHFFCTRQRTAYTAIRQTQPMWGSAAQALRSSDGFSPSTPRLRRTRRRLLCLVAEMHRRKKAPARKI